MKKRNFQFFLKKYNRYIRKYKKLSLSSPKSTQLKWLKKRILLLREKLETLYSSHSLKLKKAVSAGLIIGSLATYGIGQDFQHLKTNNPFFDVHPLQGGAKPYFVDFDGDGDDDLFVSGYVDEDLEEDFNGNFLRYYENTETGLVESLAPFPVDLGIREIAESAFGVELSMDFVDFDQDGDIDAFLTGNDVGAILYYENVDGSMVLSEENPFSELTISEDLGFVEIGDLDGDNVFEAILNNDDSISVYKLQDGKFGSEEYLGTHFFGSLTLSDLDSDNDLDLIIGNKYGELTTYVNNAGTLTLSNATKLENVELHSNPTVSFSDFDMDGDIDMLEGSNLGGIFYHENVGETFVYKNYNDEGISFLNRDFPVPEFADVDGDGDKDLILGSEVKDIAFFENVDGEFMENEADNPFALTSLPFLNTNPTCADVDMDGDIDCLIGSDFDNSFLFLRNNDGVYEEQDSMNNPFNSLREDDSARTFTFEDFDGDGDLDVFIGNKYGDIYYFVNNDGVYEEETFPLTGVNFTDYVDQMFADLDGDGDNDLIVFNSYSEIFYYEREGTDLMPREGEENPFANFDENTSKIAIYDFDQDGDNDVLASTYRGYAYYYRNNDIASSIEKIKLKNSIIAYPNPANELLNVYDPNFSSNSVIELFDLSGRLISRTLSNEELTTMDVSGITSGMYTLRITNEFSIRNSTVIIH